MNYFYSPSPSHTYPKLSIYLLSPPTHFPIIPTLIPLLTSKSYYLCLLQITSLSYLHHLSTPPPPSRHTLHPPSFIYPIKLTSKPSFNSLYLLLSNNYTYSYFIFLPHSYTSPYNHHSLPHLPTII